jgi:ABC-2 type transport system ATP-binding protein
MLSNVQHLTEMATTAPVIASWQGLSHCYDGKTKALDQLSLQILAGETLALLGPNGAGKSTAIKLLLGLLPAQQGSVMIASGNPQHAATRANLGAVLQTTGLPSQLTVLEQLRLQASYYQQSLEPMALLEQLHLSALKNRRLSALSGGERRRLEFAMALISKPRLLVLDEPTAGIDIHERSHIVELLATLKKQGCTILLTTHLIEEAERLADRIAYLEAGRLQYVGSVHALQQRAGKSAIHFSSQLSLEALRAFAASADGTLRALGTGEYQYESADINPFLRAVIASDAMAQIRSISTLRLEDALRQLYQSNSIKSHLFSI